MPIPSNPNRDTRPRAPGDTWPRAPTYARFLRRPLFWIGVLVLALLAAGVYLFGQPTRAPSLDIVTRGDIRATVNANARVRTTRFARLAFPQSGLLAKMNVKEGDAVRAGDVLAELRRDEFERRLKQAEINLKSRQLDLERALAPPSASELEIAQQTLKKAALQLAAAEERYDEEASDSNRIAKELAEADYEIARANFERTTRGPSAFEEQALKNAIENARLELESARAALDQTRLQAPFDGVVIEVNLQPGELVGGFNPVITLADTSHLELLAEIDEIDIGEVQEGQVAEIRFDAFPGQPARGQVTRVFPAATTDRGATIYHAIIALEPTSLALRPGMGATVKITTVEKKGVLLVPSRAIKNAGTQHIVTVRDAGGTRNVVVEIGLSDGERTEIVSGLSEGTTIVIE